MDIKEIAGVFDFVKLALTDDGKSALILGYKVELTDKEYGILKALLDAECAIRRSELARAVDVATSSIPVHVANINKKALPITGRKLIEGNRHAEYKIIDNI